MHHHSRKKYMATLEDIGGHMSPFSGTTRGSRSRQANAPEIRYVRFTHSQKTGPTAGKTRTDLTGLKKRKLLLSLGKQLRNEKQ